MYLVPGRNITTVGLYRDIRKWPKRDVRPQGNQKSIVNFDWLSPFSVGEIVKARYASSNQLERHVSEKGDTLSVVFQSNINPQTIIYNGKTYQLEKDD